MLKPEETKKDLRVTNTEDRHRSSKIHVIRVPEDKN